MPDWLTNLFSFTREISSKVALPIFVTLVLILFLPNEYARELGITEFRGGYRVWIGVLLLLSATALITNFLWLVGRLAKPWVKQWAFIRVNRSSLHSLTQDEKVILRQFVVDGQSSVSAQVNSGPINLLVHKNVVARASSLGLHHTLFAYIMHPWAREYLEKNRSLLD